MADPAEFPRCDHTHNCDCSGGTHSYAPFYKEVLRTIQPARVYEWGPGLNTEMALQLPTTKEVTSVEQEPKWIPKNLLRRQIILHQRADSLYYTRVLGAGAYNLFFVDSRRRAECLEVVRHGCSEAAVVCLHDAQRARYHEALAKFPYVHFPHKGFALATKSEAVYERLKDI
jgi:hypothetical protein